MSSINSVTILGAGTMGAQIALHCANAGIPALLLDVTADAGLAYVVGARVRFTASTTSRPLAPRLPVGAPQLFEGVVTAYNFSTGAMSISVDYVSGTNTYSSDMAGPAPGTPETRRCDRGTPSLPSSTNSVEPFTNETASSLAAAHDVG